MMPQFEREAPYRIALGAPSRWDSRFFVIGLFKKVVLADSVARPMPTRCSMRRGRRSTILLEAWMRRAGLHVAALFRFLRLFATWRWGSR